MPGDDVSSGTTAARQPTVDVGPHLTTPCAIKLLSDRREEPIGLRTQAVSRLRRLRPRVTDRRRRRSPSNRCRQRTRRSHQHAQRRRARRSRRTVLHPPPLHRLRRSARCRDRFARRRHRYRSLSSDQADNPRCCRGIPRSAPAPQRNRWQHGLMIFGLASKSSMLTYDLHRSTPGSLLRRRLRRRRPADRKGTLTMASGWPRPRRSRSRPPAPRARPGIRGREHEDCRPWSLEPWSLENDDSAINFTCDTTRSCQCASCATRITRTISLLGPGPPPLIRFSHRRSRRQSAVPSSHVPISDRSAVSSNPARRSPIRTLRSPLGFRRSVAGPRPPEGTA